MKSLANRETVGKCKAAKMTDAQKEVIESQVGQFLQRQYPGYVWYTDINQRVLMIKCLSANQIYGFTMDLKDLTPEMHKIMLAAGEVLERHRLNRIRANHEELMHVGRDIRGNVKADV